MENAKPKITRRMFLKTSAATAAIVAVSETLRGKSKPTFVKSVQAANEEVVKYGNCAFCQQGDCQTIVKMVNGVVVKVEGDPDSPISQGMLPHLPDMHLVERCTASTRHPS